ncbi:SipW-cognate class signal peptide [Oribacterium sp. KHPX15]|uniref:TasA family protein n=1 Tax=unclassified Oribacterium TaxID=2629782 RepID=UPI0004E144E5|nr:MULTISPECIES: TasA family protein [unclassified Oribacterium]SEA47092.1 SipW-cognate class signal peptide [Oribacterium sp. KHPX15]
MKKKRIAAAVGIMAIISAITGTYAYFTDLKSVSVMATAANLGITVDATNFNEELVYNMLPGDSKELSYTISNTGDADVMVFTEITLISSVPMSDTVEWFIQDPDGSVNEEDRRVDPEFVGKNFVDDVSIQELQENNIKFVSLTKKNTEAKFVVNNGVLEANSDKTSTVDLMLMLGLNAGNKFMDSTCLVTADVYGIQTKNIDDTLSWEFIKETALVNEESEGL